MRSDGRYHRLMASPFPPSSPPNPDRSRLIMGAVVLLVLLAVASLIAVAAVLVRDSDDDDDLTTSGVTTRQAIATTSSRAATATTAVATSSAGYGTTACPPAAGATAATRTFTAPFQKCIDAAKKYTAVVVTNKGELTIQLDPAQAPLTVNNFVSLARSRYFDNTNCHRIIPTFVVQCGDPLGTGMGGPGYKFVDELPKAGQYTIGSLAMANSGANTNGSQFFIITGSQGVALQPSYSLFGQVTAGADTTLKALDAVGTSSGAPKEPITITSVRITES
jgi:cyclophilin family peptidyl-prolyl cis-trans isomerase